LQHTLLLERLPRLLTMSSETIPTNALATTEPTPIPSARSDMVISIPVMNVVTVDGKSVRQDVSWEGSLRSLISEKVQGAGNVQLDHLYVYRCFTRRDQVVHVELQDANAVSIPDRLHKWMWSETSTKYSKLTPECHEFEIPSFVSRQVIPTSSMAPDFKLSISCSANAKLTLEVHVSFTGPLRVLVSPNFS